MTNFERNTASPEALFDALNVAYFTGFSHGASGTEWPVNPYAVDWLNNKAEQEEV